MRSGPMLIGALSKKSGVTIDAIRFYEKQRLVYSARRSSGGFRLFSEEQLAILRFIKSAQELGFSLDEIRELLALKDDRARACPKMQQLLRTRLEVVESKISRLKAIRAELRSALKKCDTALRASSGNRTDGCPVLQDISGGRKPGV